MGKSVVISAPSGAGKTSIVNYLLNEMVDLEFSISACNRAKRHNEVDGEHYHFLETIDFKKRYLKDYFWSGKRFMKISFMEHFSLL